MYDGVAILEAPDDATAGACVLAAVGGGYVKATKTSTLPTVSEAMDMMGKAGSIVYQALTG